MSLPPELSTLSLKTRVETRVAYCPAADIAAALSREFVMFQMPAMLPPALMNRAADAKATKANSNVYSIRSWP